MGRPQIYDESLRERLIAVTAERASAEGFAAVSLRQVAAAADTTTAAIYSLFGDKGGLHRAVFERAVDKFAARLHAVDTTGDPHDAIVRLGLEYRKAALADPHGYLIMFDGYSHPGVVDPELAVRMASTFEPLLACVARGVADGGFPAQPGAAAIATALWANVHGLVSIEIHRVMPVRGAAIEALAEASIRRSVEAWAL